MNVGLLIGSCLTASLSPGPAALSTIETSLRYGKRRDIPAHTGGGDVPGSAATCKTPIYL